MLQAETEVISIDCERYTKSYDHMHPLIRWYSPRVANPGKLRLLGPNWNTANLYTTRGLKGSMIQSLHGALNKTKDHFSSLYLIRSI